MGRALVVGCLLILVIQAIVQIRLASLDSATTDEGVHISAGYTYLTKHDFRFNPEHPPLVKVLAALPLLVIRPVVSPRAEQMYQQSGNFFYDSWRENRSYGEIMMYQSGNNPDQLIFWARMPMVALTLILGLVIFLIAWRHWGEKAAFVATSLYAFNPTVNGHGHLVTTDIGIALGFLLTIYWFWRLLEKPTWKNCLWLGLSLGFALLTKHTAIILLPVMFLLAVWRAFDRPVAIAWPAVGWKFLAALLITWAVIWAGFGFQDRALPPASSASSEITIAGNQSEFNLHGPSDPKPVVAKPRLDQLYSLTRPALVIFPGDYLKGMFMVLGHASGGHNSFLLGKTSKTGWWYYFPVLLLTKTPLAELVLLTLGLSVVVRSKPKEKIAMAMMIAGTAYLLVAIASRADLGIRHIMPFFPLIFLAASWGLATLNRQQGLTTVLLIWLFVTFIVSFPTYLGYFNEAVGGARNGYRIATDSNLDWGQDLKRIKAYVDANPTSEKPFIDYSWAGQSSLDYYLGANSYIPIEDWQPGEAGPAIFGASAYAYAPFKDGCINLRRITPGVFSCWLTNK